MIGRRAGVGALLATGALGLGCLDSSGPRSARRVALALEPVFENLAPQDGVPTDVDSFFIRISNPPAPEVTRGIRVAPNQDAITISLEVEIMGGLDSVTVSFEGYNSASGLLLYQGSTTIAVTLGLPSIQAPVSASYVGPGREIRRLAVIPRSAALAPGGTVQLAYDGFDTANVVMPDNIVFVRYRSSNSGVASVAPNGLVTAVANGQARVLVISLTDSTIRDTCTVDVGTGTPPLASITVNPTFLLLQPGSATQSLAVSGRDGSGNPVTVTGVAYTSRSPAVATVNPATGAVTAVAGGTAVLVATAQGLSDSMLVAVAATGSAVVAALSNAGPFDRVSVGDTVRVAVVTWLAAVAPEKLGSYNDSLVRNPAVLRYLSDTTVTGDFAAPTVNRANVTAGRLRFGSADALGAAGPTVILIRVTLVAQAAGSTALTQGLTDLTAAATFLQMLPAALVVNGQVRVQ